MNQICLVIPVMPGKSDDARDFMRELEQERKADYDQSERRIGITKEVWYLARAPGGDQLVGYMETSDFGKALSLFSASRDEFDMWFKRRLADSTGLDLNNPPPMQLPELLSSYSA
jgi:Family of unknown function (DUF6176)